MRHLLTLAELRPSEIEHIYAISEDLKTKYSSGKREPLLPGRVMALLFEKPSLRTRVSFEAAMHHLGGGSLFLGADSGFGTRETPGDFARVLSQYVDVIVARVFSHQTLEELSAFAECSVINGLSDQAHPCQALADLFTIRERLRQLNGHTLCYIGDGNNVARSLALACGKLGMRFCLAAPTEYQFDGEFLKSLDQDLSEGERVFCSDPVEAVRGASVIYTDVWASMGQEQEADQRRAEFAPYQVNAALMKHARPDALFMHCLPARRGEEVTDEVIDGPQSVVIEQAANRMHLQKGLLAWLLGSQAPR